MEERKWDVYLRKSQRRETWQKREGPGEGSVRELVIIRKKKKEKQTEKGGVKVCFGKGGLAVSICARTYLVI